MTRTATWNNIGTTIDTCVTISDVLKTSGLDYTVEKKPIFLENGFEIPNKVATVKAETNQFIGVVSPSYQVYQNEEAFGFIDNIPNVKFVKAGETRNGMVYIIGELPSTTVLGDTFTPHIIFQTSHNGLFNVRATICPLRVVCQNQFAMSFKAMKNTMDIRHSRQLVQKIEQAQRLIIDTATYMHSFSDTAEELAMLKIGSAKNVYEIIDAFFDTTKEMTERQQKAIEEKKANVINCYHADDNQNFIGTAWGVVNAFSDYFTHAEAQKKTKTIAETKFTTVTFDGTNMNKLLECINAKTS
jgi:phage/plasmid-like protein (TIGR03299 family)